MNITIVIIGTLPMIEIGFRANRMRPLTPMYLLLHPADQRRTTYSSPKNTTKTISCNCNNSVMIIKQRTQVRRTLPEQSPVNVTIV